MKIDYLFNVRNCACYNHRKLWELYGDNSYTLREILTKRDGPWKQVPFEDRLWVFKTYEVCQHLASNQPLLRALYRYLTKCRSTYVITGRVQRNRILWYTWYKSMSLHRGRRYDRTVKEILLRHLPE